jgi:hypothetical protein
MSSVTRAAETGLDPKLSVIEDGLATVDLKGGGLQRR